MTIYIVQNAVVFKKQRDEIWTNIAARKTYEEAEELVDYLKEERKNKKRTWEVKYRIDSVNLY